MKDINDKLEYKGKEYTLVFNLNVLEAIQEEYGTLTDWIEKAYGKGTNEPSAKALAFVIAEMVNEGIDIDNDERAPEEAEKPITPKTANRMLSEFMKKSGGLEKVIEKVDKLMGESLQGGENSKNE